jgi:hypothetical protein
MWYGHITGNQPYGKGVTEKLEPWIWVPGLRPGNEQGSLGIGKHILIPAIYQKKITVELNKSKVT